MAVNILPGMNAGASTYAVPSPIKGSGTAWVLLGSWALSPARPTPIHPRHECRGLSAFFGELPIPDGPMTVGIDGGYVKAQGMEQAWFEVIAGKSIVSFRRGEDQPNSSIKCFSFVRTYDEKPKRRLHEHLQSQGLQMNQQIEFLSDGGDTVRDVQLYLSPEADHLLDWFHITMRLTTMTQSAKGLPEKMGEEETLPLRDEVLRQLERTKWFLWHGNVFQALKVLNTIHLDLELASWERDDH